MSAIQKFLLTCLLALTAVSVTAQPLVTDDPAASEAEAGLPRQVAMETSLGLILIELFTDKAPQTVANFVSYVEEGFYDGTIFHRIIPGFVVQGGGFDSDFQRKTTRAPIANESTPSVKNQRGTLSMARLPNPDSATTQFFINLVDNASLDWKPNQPGYAVFGRVVSGMELVDQMAQFPQGNYAGAFANAPNTPILIQKMSIANPDDTP